MGRMGYGSTGGNPLTQLTHAQLRRRTSMKWRSYPPDVLPLWVAEMDVPLAEPVARALTDAIALGDTGYPVGTGYVAALDEFARDAVGLGRGHGGAHGDRAGRDARHRRGAQAGHRSAATRSS